MIRYIIIILIVLFCIILFKKYYKSQYEYNNIKCLVVICGGARTFEDCIDSQYENIISKLSQDISILFYLKKKDPGPKNQDGWNFQYKDIESESINNKINELKNKNITIYSNIIDGDEINNDDLLKIVKDRSKYNDFLNNDDKLIRCLQQLYNFKRCGELIQKQNINYDYYIFLRPDLFFTEKCFPIEKYSNNKVTLQPSNLNDYHIDHLAIIPKNQFEKFFFDRIKMIQTNDSIVFGNTEQIFAHTIDYEEKKIGEYYIKR